MNATAEQTTTETSTKFVVEEYLPYGDKWVWSSDHDNLDDAVTQKGKWAAAYQEHNLFRIVEKTVTTTTKVVG